MKIILNNIGKRYNGEWIFRKISYEFSMGNKYAILGINGSGKSTLVQIIAGYVSFNEGSIFYEENISDTTATAYCLPEDVRQRTDPTRRGLALASLLSARGRPPEDGLSPFGRTRPLASVHMARTRLGEPTTYSFAAPYLELLEEMTWKEAVKFHGKFKKFVSGFNEEKIIELSGLKSSSEKQIRDFSSGMKQRAKLALAILSSTPLLLLDEPATNLDENGVKWYNDLISEFAKEKLVIVCSNYNKDEYSFCEKELKL
jgi:ABC-type multidrug transport system ATPase subunit